MKTVYTPQGEKVEMEGVDARECVEHCGYSYTPPIQAQAPAADVLLPEVETPSKAQRGRPANKR